jgi:hypothetical protein
MLHLRDNMSSAIQSDVRYFGRKSNLPDQGYSERPKPNFGCTTGGPDRSQAISGRDETPAMDLPVAG